MSPVLTDAPLVIVSLPADQADELMSEAYAMVREHEGITLVISTELAKRHGVDTTEQFRMISLRVASDLHAVGLTAAFARALGEEAIPANVLAGYFHDHILVPAAMADRAMATLTELSRTVR
jgi:hypothetical protein